jgi:hypothetical protein
MFRRGNPVKPREPKNSLNHVNQTIPLNHEKLIDKAYCKQLPDFYYEGMSASAPVTGPRRIRRSALRAATHTVGDDHVTAMTR